MSFSDELLTPAEAARLLRVDPKTVAVWAERGAVRHLTTPGGHRRYHRRDIENLLHHPPPGPRST